MYHEPLWGTRSSHEKAQVFLKPSMKISLSLHLSKLWTRKSCHKDCIKSKNTTWQRSDFTSSVKMIWQWSNLQWAPKLIAPKYSNYRILLIINFTYLTSSTIFMQCLQNGLISSIFKPLTLPLTTVYIKLVSIFGGIVTPKMSRSVCNDSKSLQSLKKWHIYAKIHLINKAQQ